MQQTRRDVIETDGEIVIFDRETGAYIRGDRDAFPELEG